MFSKPIGVMEGLRLSMATGESTICRVIAMAHPKEAFVEQDGLIPALWLSDKSRYPKLQVFLMRMMEPSDCPAAIRTCAKNLALDEISTIHAAMEFQSVWPDRAKLRRERRERKLAKHLGRLIRAAAERPGIDESQLVAQAMGGIQHALEQYGRVHRGSSRWLVSLQWDSLVEAAHARAQRKAMESISSENTVESGPSLAKRL